MTEHTKLGCIEISIGGEVVAVGAAESLRGAARKLGALARPVPEETDTLREVLSVMQLVNAAMIQAEAVHGIRLIEPRNDLVQELKELTWCIARLSGTSDQALPPEREPTAAQGAQRRTETARTDRQDGLSR